MPPTKLGPAPVRAPPARRSRTHYNFAADILERNLKAGRANKAAYIDPRGSWTYGQLAERVDRFGHVLRSLGIRREERILLASSTPSTGPPPFSAPSRPAWCRFRSTR